MPVHQQGVCPTCRAVGHSRGEKSIIVDFYIKACVSSGVPLGEICASINQWTAGAEKAKPLVERRRSVRVPTNDRAVLSVLRPEPSGHIDARVLDASREGLRLMVANELMRGSIIQVHVHRLFILAEVRYCRQEGAAFHVGVRIQDVFPAHERPKVEDASLE